jgi:hypothetical protein
VLVRFRANGQEFSASVFLFDKDGTLITFDHWFRVMAERARRLEALFSLSSAEAAALRKFMGVERGEGWGIIPLPRLEAEEATARFLSELLGLPLAEVFPKVQKVFAEVDAAFPFENHLRPTPGAEEVLLGIKRAGGKVGVVTHDLASAALASSSGLGMGRAGGCGGWARSLSCEKTCPGSCYHRLRPPWPFPKRRGNGGGHSHGSSGWSGCRLPGRPGGAHRARCARRALSSC